MVIRNDAHRDEFHRDQQWHKPVRVATTANITIATALNAGDTIDGVTLADGDRVLVKDQSTGAENGIYDVGATPKRAYDMLAGIQARGAFVYVVDGTTNGGKLFKNTNTSLPTIDTDALTWTEFSGGGAPTGADYLTGTAQAGLSAEIVVGTTPGGELGGTWASPTVDATHSGSAHTDFIAKSILTTQDDIIVRDGTGPARLGKGSDGQVLTVDPTTHHLVWATPSSGFTNPMTTRGDIIIEDSAPAPARLAIGSAHKVLHSDGTDPSWQKVDETDLNLTDVTTANSSTGQHGFLKKLDNSASHFMDGQGNWSVPAGTGAAVLMDPFYGDGRDGDVTISVDTTITRDMYYNNLTVDSGIFLDSALCRIFVKGTLTLTGTIRCNGNNGGAGGNGTGAAGGAAGSAGTQQTGGAQQTLSSGPVGRAGAVGGINANGSGTTAATSTTYFGIVAPAGTAGGISGSGRSGGAGGAAGTGDETVVSKPLWWPRIIDWRTDTTTAINLQTVTATGAQGGSGGGAAGAGGGGSGGTGSGGGIVVVCAKTITGAGTIQAKGGNGGQGGNGFTGGQAGGGSGGNGGQGGIVVLIYKDGTGFSGTLDVAGGTKGGKGNAGGGAGSTDGGTGNDGTAGRSFSMQLG